MIYQILSTISALIQSNDSRVEMQIVLFTGIVTITSYFIIFLLKAIAVCRMAKKRGFKNWWVGMLPYGNFFMIGKLAGPVRVFQIDLKNIGLITMISAIIYDLINVYSILVLLEIPLISSPVLNVAVVSGSYIIELVYYLSYIMLASAIFGKYAPNKRLMFTLLSIIEPVFSILLLVVMNRKPYDSYDDYYKERMARRFGQNYNPFEKPYNTKENPFSNYDTNKNNSNSVEDPFDEFKGD